MVHVNNLSSQRLRLTKALKGYLPSRMDQTEVHSSVDTPENQFVLSFLKFASGIIECISFGSQKE